MKSSYSELRARTQCIARIFAIPVLVLALVLVGLSATADAATAPDAGTGAAPETYHVLYLTGVVNQRDAVEVVSDLRNLLGRARIYYVPSQNAISMMSTEHDFAVAQKIVAEMNRGPRVFRVTYTLTKLANGHEAGHHSVAVIVASGEQALLRQGERVPLVTGRDSTDTHGASQQVQYIDVGLNLSASLRGPADDLVLQTRVTESAVIPGMSVAGLPDPVIRQTSLDNVSIIAAGKPLVIGLMDIPGTSKQEEIAVTVEPVQ